MARKLSADRVLFLTALLLVFTGIVMVYSASAVSLAVDQKEGHYFVARQILWAVLGVAVLAIAMHVDYRTYRSYAFVWTLLALVGLMLAAVFSMEPVKDAQRWLRVGPLTFQPSELAKLACVLFTAQVLERRMHRIDEVGYSLLPIGAIVGAQAVLILCQPDYGTASTLLLVAGVMIFAAGLRPRYLFAAGGLVALIMAVALVLRPYRVIRLITFLDPWANEFGSGWQAVQAQIAVGTGGLLGRGLMAPGQTLFFLPEPHNDFIFAVIGEELGLIGATAVLLCFCVIAWRGLRIALRAQDAFGGFVALGITMMIAVQALINISVVLSLLPTKGIPLPFVSAGGSSLIVSLLGIGIMLNISQHETAEGV